MTELSRKGLWNEAETKSKVQKQRNTGDETAEWSKCQIGTIKIKRKLAMCPTKPHFHVIRQPRAQKRPYSLRPTSPFLSVSDSLCSLNVLKPVHTSLHGRYCDEPIAIAGNEDAPAGCATQAQIRQRRLVGRGYLPLSAFLDAAWMNREQQRLRQQQQQSIGIDRAAAASGQDIRGGAEFVSFERELSEPIFVGRHVCRLEHTYAEAVPAVGMLPTSISLVRPFVCSLGLARSTATLITAHQVFLGLGTVRTVVRPAQYSFCIPTVHSLSRQNAIPPTITPQRRRLSVMPTVEKKPESRFRERVTSCSSRGWWKSSDKVRTLAIFSSENKRSFKWHGGEV